MRAHPLALALSLVVLACGRTEPGPSAPAASPLARKSTYFNPGVVRVFRDDAGASPCDGERLDFWARNRNLVARARTGFSFAHVTRDVPSVDITFPQLAEGEGASFGPVDAAIRTFVNAELREYLDDLSGGEDAGSPDLKGLCQSCLDCCTCTAKCVPTWVSSRLTSVACTKSCGGGAYPNTGWWTLVLDATHPSAPRPVRLDELVPPERRDDFWRALDQAVRVNAACMGWTSWDSPLDEEALGDLPFFVTPEALVVVAPLPHAALAFAPCAFRRTPNIEWLRPDISW